MILKMWDRVAKLPLGKAAFSRLVGFYVPYTGSIHPFVEDLRPGYARVTLRDRRAVRNHLSSIHAVALMNLGEAASGMALMAGLPDYARAILVGFQIEYLKKARGTLTGIGDCEIPKVEKGTPRFDYTVEAKIYNQDKELLCNVKAKWVIDGGKAKS